MPKTMSKLLKSTLQTAQIENISWKIQSAVVLALVGISSKIYLECFNFVKKHNFEILENAGERPDEVPLVTVSNHTCCLDDPCLWGLLKVRSLLNSRKKIRWTLGARELLFSTPLHSAFFSRGKIIPVVRGDGVYQQGMETALELLNDGQWIHVFPEGGVNVNDAIKRLKWGVGRLIAEAKVTPIVIPFWHEGMDDVLPNHSPYIPRIMKRVTVLIGEPMEFTDTLREFRIARKSAMETRKHITDMIQERFKELKSETRLLHSKWR
ncbi:tafazzin-like [Acropora millepora]|uniref:tafazzin-like n=1 Tax=Acropora millepora TaxID=45264 RepID=UPI001CF5D62C|nr:tafazzin-like [Acropora millepora]